MKTVFIGLNWLGDIIMSFPTIIQASKHSEVHILTRKNLAKIYELLPFKAHIHTLNNKTDIFASLKTLKNIRKLKADLIIILPKSFRSALTGKLCGSKQETGYAAELRSWLLSNPIYLPENFKSIHEANLHYNLLPERLKKNNLPDLTAPKFSESLIESCLSKLNLSKNSFFITLAPGAAFGAAKRWPPEKFAALASDILKNFDCKIVVTASAGEADISRQISQINPERIIDAAGKTDLNELAIILSKTKALIANDSGTMHMAALFNTPTIVPVGPTDMIRTGPLNRNSYFVTGNEKCSIAPCRKKACQFNHHMCMQSINTSQILKILDKVIADENIGIKN